MPFGVKKKVSECRAFSDLRLSDSIHRDKKTLDK